VLWGERGVVQAMFEPLALWRAQCSTRVSGRALAAGHFLAEERPAETAAALLDFFS
jgi:haloacetate dehalogenase